MIVYKITNKINGKLYFGISKCSIKKRWNEHKSKSRSGKSHLSLAIKKYGVSSFCIELIRECFSEKEMYDLEIDFIKKYKTNNPLYGYNNSCGGEVSSKGKTLSDETRRKISEYQKVRDRKPHSEQAKKNMSILAKGRDMTELIKKSALKRKGKQSHNICSVSKYSNNNVFIEKYSSLTLAAKSVNGRTSAFCALKRGRLKTYKNFIWKFEC